MASFEQKAKKRIVKSTQTAPTGAPHFSQVAFLWLGESLWLRPEATSQPEPLAEAAQPGTWARNQGRQHVPPLPHLGFAILKQDHLSTKCQFNDNAHLMPMYSQNAVSVRTGTSSSSRKLEAHKVFSLDGGRPFRAIVPWLSLAGQCNGWIKWVKTESTPSH